MASGKTDSEIAACSPHTGDSFTEVETNEYQVRRIAKFLQDASRHWINRTRTKPWNSLLGSTICCVAFWVVYSGWWFHRHSSWNNLAEPDLRGNLFPELLESPVNRPQSDERCSSRAASKSYMFNFDITPMAAASQCWYGEPSAGAFTEDPDANKTCWRLLDFASAESRKNLQGRINIVRGSSLQISDIEAHVTISSDDAQDLDNVIVGKVDWGLNMGYQFRDNSDYCTDVSITISLRPSKIDIFLFKIWTDIFDISFEPQLSWTMDRLHTHTTHGSTNMDARPYSDALHTDHIEMHSFTGSITGFFLPHSSLHISTTSGPITISMHSSHLSHSTNPSIALTTTSGAIYIQSTGALLPSAAFTHTTTLSTQIGNIYAVLPHGLSTGASTVSGNITLYLRPFKDEVPGRRNDIWTSSTSGYVRVWIDEPRDTNTDPNTETESGTETGTENAKERPQYNPLLHSISSHSMLGEGGSMTLRYPHAWYGELEAEVRHGRLDVEGSLLWVVDKGEGFVRAKRGSGGRSQMGIVVNRGSVDLRVGM